MEYNQLHTILSGIENQTTPQVLAFPSVSSIMTNGDALLRCQTVALDSTTQNNEMGLPIVVAIGANYTQGDHPVPRDQGVGTVADSLNSNRQRIVNAFDHYNQHQDAWVGSCAISSADIQPPKEFHLVMTNFCLWITVKSWQKTRAQVRADLLENNPTCNGISTCPGEWAHLVALANSLADQDVLWVGHGVHCEVFALFRQFVRCLKIPKWMLLPNLSYPYRYNEWPFVGAAN